MEKGSFEGDRDPAKDIKRQQGEDYNVFYGTYLMAVVDIGVRSGLVSRLQGCNQDVIVISRTKETPFEIERDVHRPSIRPIARFFRWRGSVPEAPARLGVVGYTVPLDCPSKLTKLLLHEVKSYPEPFKSLISFADIVVAINQIGWFHTDRLVGSAVGSDVCWAMSDDRNFISKRGRVV